MKIAGQINKEPRTYSRNMIRQAAIVLAFLMLPLAAYAAPGSVARFVPMASKRS